MKQIGLLLLCVSFSLNIYGTVEASPLSKVFGLLGSTFSFGLDMYKSFDRSDNGNKTPTDDKNMEELNKELSDRIDVTTKRIEEKIDLHGPFNRLLEIKNYIKALLTEIKHIMESKYTQARDENIRRFKRMFEQHEADIQAIVRLLTSAIPINGQSKRLIDMVAEQVGCSLTDLQEFEDDYMKMVSNAFAIAITYEKFNHFDLSNQTIAFWTESVEILKETFKLQREKCIARFPHLVKDDLEGDENATDLQRKNAHRYSDKLNCVVYGAKGTDWDIKYLEQDDYIFTNTTSAKPKFLFFYFKLTKTDDNYTKVVPTDREIYMLEKKLNEGKCDMKTIGKTIDDMFFWRGYILRSRLIVNPNQENEQAIDQSSRTIYSKACGKDIVISVAEMKAENASSLVYKTMTSKRDTENSVTPTCGVAIVPVSTATMMLCLVIRYTLQYNV